MKVLVACEFSGIVRDAFSSKGHDAISCDIVESEAPGNHYLGSVFDIIHYGFDIMIAHPPCTDIAVSGARHFEEKRRDGRYHRGIAFIMRLVMESSHIPHVAIENPVSMLSTEWRKPDQTIQPYQFGHGETKRTCLWLKGLPLLTPTNIVAGRTARIHRMPPSPTRAADRSRTYHGIAEAMAEQWGSITRYFEGPICAK